MGRPKVYENAAARIKAHREKHNLKSFTIELPAEVYEGLEKYLEHRGEAKSTVITRLIKNQLLRKR
jgi:metal-responsive CopG/Arc/MetJ family transcriptional regulator